MKAKGSLKYIKSKTPGVIGVLIGFGSFGNLWFSVDLGYLTFGLLIGYWIDNIKVLWQLL